MAASRKFRQYVKCCCHAAVLELSIAQLFIQKQYFMNAQRRAAHVPLLRHEFGEAQCAIQSSFNSHFQLPDRCQFNIWRSHLARESAPGHPTVAMLRYSRCRGCAALRNVRFTSTTSTSESAPPLLSKIRDDLKTAMRSKDKPRSFAALHHWPVEDKRGLRYMLD